MNSLNSKEPDSKLEIIDVFGNYLLENFNEESSERLIIIAKNNINQ